MPQRWWQWRQRLPQFGDAHDGAVLVGVAMLSVERELLGGFDERHFKDTGTR